MGQVHAIGIHYEGSKTTPEMNKPSAFPDQYGFEENGQKRKERVMVASKDELVAARVPPRYRDFCAHKYIQFKTCARSVYPLVYRCAHERHEWEECMVEDYNISRKEYERDQRLLQRKAGKDRLERIREERRKYLEEAAAAEH